MLFRSRCVVGRIFVAFSLDVGRVNRFLPHLIKYNERISINNINISDEEISKILEKVSAKVDVYNNTHVQLQAQIQQIPQMEVQNQ